MCGTRQNNRSWGGGGVGAGVVSASAGAGSFALLCWAVLAAAAQSGEQRLSYGGFGFKISERNWHGEHNEKTEKERSEGTRVRVTSCSLDPS